MQPISESMLTCLQLQTSIFDEKSLKTAFFNECNHDIFKSRGELAPEHTPVTSSRALVFQVSQEAEEQSLSTRLCFLLVYVLQ